MQIAESLATGAQVFDHKDNPCPNETKAMKVLYIDAELTYKQIENRYKNSITGENYILSHNIIRAHIDRDFEWQKGDNMEELVKVDIRDLIELHEPEALIVDNLKMLKSGTEKSQEAIPMMFELNNLKKKCTNTKISYRNQKMRKKTNLKTITKNFLRYWCKKRSTR